MSIAPNPTSSESSKLPSSACALSASAPAVDETLSQRVCEELGRLAEFMPQRYREVFCFRWGLCGHFSHVTSQVARKFEMSRATVDEMLERCLWNIARHAHGHELSALFEVLGDDPQRWAERAWAHAERRWGNQDSQFSETVLLLSAAGVDVPEARRVARQHMVDIGLGRGNKWGGPITSSEKAGAARQAVDRIVAHVIWPSRAARLSSLEAFQVRRALPPWAGPRTGMFQSHKLCRLVQFDSELELVILRQLEADPRVVEYQEQPVTIPYVLDGEPREYTPDVIVRLEDGRAFIIEAKPLEGLGEFTNWMKWASLASWCERAGLGFWIGSPQRSIIDHRRIQPDPERREFVAEEVQAGEAVDEDYIALKRLVGIEQIGLIATADLLDWRVDARRGIRPAQGAEREEAQSFWARVDESVDKQVRADISLASSEEVDR